MGMGGGVMAVPPTGASAPAGPMPQQTSDREQELQMLKSQAQQLETQLQATNAQINDIEPGGRVLGLTAVVDSEKCTGCRICEDICPANAIKVNGLAVVQLELCSGCWLCIAECPNKAISLQKV
ncbi:unnamed protein product [marine sediment metagenome]|uniref:4Fe-4S ferredoxin-type domain-containing protein n=1 Tax=marine sediment metagenome TaxID=412755 RepID=X0UW50_9ZZZZ